jgi:hypothetical protein
LTLTNVGQVSVSLSNLGVPGDQGIPGEGVPVGGTTGQVLAKVNGTDYNTEWVTPDHGALTGLGDDDHTQYHNDARGDARYSQLGHNHAGVYDPAGTASAAVAAHVAALDPHSQYAADSDLSAHVGNTSNPHSVTKAQVGLGDVDNTSDLNKPISTATQSALDGKEPTIAAGTTAQYWRGDKTWQTLPGGVTDHGALTGLGDDDHTQYHTDARGDARYSQLGHNHAGVYDPAGSAASAQAYAIQRANHTGTQLLATISDAGTAAALNVAVSGNAASGEVVKGSDTRLTDARTPTAHTHPLGDLTQTGATTGQVPTWTGAEWVPQTPTAGGSSQLVLVQNESPSFTAPATSFTLSNSDALNGTEAVYIAGVRLTRGTDYTVGSWPTITLVGLTLETGANLRVDYVRPPSASPVPAAFVFVSAKGDFPAPSGGVITLAVNTTYYIVSHVDLLGDRLAASANSTILGASSENCSLTSTGLTGSPLLTSGYTVPIRNLSFTDCEQAVAIDQGVNPDPVAIDWHGINFVNCTISGVIGTVQNFIFTDGALLNSGKLSFTGTVGTIGFSGCLFSKTSGTATLLELTASCVVTRRFRVIYSSFVAVGTVTAINVSASATIPTESYILDTCNFSGGGTYLSGVTHTSNDSLFVKCVGITNTSVNGQMYMNGNTTATTISNTADFFKIAGTTSASADNAKYDHSDNRLTNRATISRKYFIHADLSYTAGANQVIEAGFYDSKIAAVRTPSRTKSTANGAGRAENVSLSCVVNHSDGDYLELWIRNTTSAANITVDHINFTITELGS